MAEQDTTQQATEVEEIEATDLPETEEQEPEVDDEAETEEPEVEDEDDPALAALLEAIGDDDPDPKLLEALTPEAIEKVPGFKTFAKAFRARVRQQDEKRQAKLEQERTAVQAERKAADEKWEAVNRAQAELRTMLTDPAIREAVKRGKDIDPATLDLGTDEGVAQKIEYEIAQKVGPLSDRVFAVADESARQAEVRSLREQYPDFKPDSPFEKEVKTRLQAIKAEKGSVEGMLPHVVRDVDHARLRKIDEERRTARRKQQAESARRTARATAPSADLPDGELPPEALKLTGRARIEWLNRHPKIRDAHIAKRQWGAGR